MSREKTAFAALIRDLRKKHGLSLGQSSKRIGISKAHLHQMESGLSANPTVNTVRDVADVYGIAATTLFRASITPVTDNMEKKDA